MMGSDTGYTGIGEELRQARIRRGRSIAQAHQATRIARHYLEALEDEDWRRMPAAPFTRGFLSSYAQYLGLDDGALLERFPFEPSAPGEGLQLSDDTIESYQAAERSAGPREEIRPSRVHLGPWLAAAVVVLVIIGAVVAVVSLRDEVEPVEPEESVPGIRQLPSEVQEASSGTPVDADFEPLPDLREFSSREATNFIKSLNAPYVIVSIYDDSPLGTVLEQSPAPGAQPPEDAVVTLVVSRGPRPGTSIEPAADRTTDSSTSTTESESEGG